MDLFVHYTALPSGMELDEVVDGLNRAVDDGGFVNGGITLEHGGRIDMELEDETMNPKLAQGAVKQYLRRAGFPADTVIELGGMRINVCE